MGRRPWLAAVLLITANVLVPAPVVPRAGAWTGNEVQVVEHTRRRFAALVRAANPLVAALRTEGIPLTPKTRQLLRRAA
jgi:hypothetical protein